MYITASTTPGARSSPDSSAVRDAVVEELEHACEQHDANLVMDGSVDKALNEVAIQKLFAQNVGG